MRYWIIFLIIINLKANNDIILLLKNIENFKYKIILNEIYNPFCKLKKVKKINLIDVKSHNKQSKKVYIKAIFNNQVFINNKWYKVNDKINDYIIYKITDNAVFFKKGKKIIKLKIKEGL